MNVQGSGDKAFLKINLRVWAIIIASLGTVGGATFSVGKELANLGIKAGDAYSTSEKAVQKVDYIDTHGTKYGQDQVKSLQARDREIEQKADQLAVAIMRLGTIIEERFPKTAGR